LRNICTASSINEEKRLWLTAAHCVDGTEPVYLLGEGVTMVIQDVKADIAIVSTVTAALPALKLATKGPRVEDRIKVAGYPFGFTQPLITLGTVATPSIVLDPNYPAFMLIQAAGAPGNSGSPIVNTKHEIVSVLQIGWGRTFSPIMGGATFDVLAGYRLYWQ
jgi:S1-C subfamily serine protease